MCARRRECRRWSVTNRVDLRSRGRADRAFAFYLRRLTARRGPWLLRTCVASLGSSVRSKGPRYYPLRAGASLLTFTFSETRRKLRPRGNPSRSSDQFRRYVRR
jgi:hypothetical protein